MSSQIKGFFEDLTNETKNKANIEIEDASPLIKKFDYIGIPNYAKEKLKEGINLRNAGTYFNYRDAVYKSYVSKKALIDSLITTLSGQMSVSQGQFNGLKKELDQMKPKVENNKMGVLVIATIALFSGIIILNLGFTPANLLSGFENTMAMISIIAFPISLLLLLIGSIEYAFTAHKKKNPVTIN